MIFQRTGLTEGTILYNDFLKGYGLYRLQTEDNFINWLYTTSGFYDKTISGSNFNIDTQAVRDSSVYYRWKSLLMQALHNSDRLNMMVHNDFWVDYHHLSEFISSFRKQEYDWSDPDFIKPFLKGRVLVINGFAPLIAQKYGVIPLRTPFTFFNNGPHQNYFETLEDIISQVPKFDVALVSCGSYGPLIANRIGNSLVVGSGLQKIFPLDNIPDEYKPEGYQMIENGRYWDLRK